MRRESTVAIYGLGGVGLSLVAAFLHAYPEYNIIGVDIDHDKIEKIENGEIYHPDPHVVKRIKKGILLGRFIVTLDGIEASKKSRIKIITVPLLLDTNMEPDFDPLDDAIIKVAKGLRRGDIVIVETSLPPGTTEERIKPMLEEISGLRAEEEFYLAYSPERIEVERALYDLEKAYPKIVGGIGPKSTEVVMQLYSRICKKGVIKASSPTVAEFEKILEGIYRDVNIGLANELANIARELGIDFEEARILANSHPLRQIHKPGPGVGGICIPIYPYLMMWVAKKLNISMPITSTARYINERQPLKIIELIRKVINVLTYSKKLTIGILGVAFKGGVSDTRNSPAIAVLNHLIAFLKKTRKFDILVYDPYVHLEDFMKYKIFRNERVVIANNLKDVIRRSNVILILTDHPEFSSPNLLSILIEFNIYKEVALVDARDSIDFSLIRNFRYTQIKKMKKSHVKKLVYIGVGRPLVNIYIE